MLRSALDSHAPFVVAHRAGNDLARLRAAEALRVPLIEADVHLFAGRLEVRHLKTLGPFPILWDRWELAPPWAPLEPAAPAATIAVPGGVALAGARTLDAKARDRAERFALDGAQLARRAGLEARSRAVRSDAAPWRAIVELAEELDASAIVTGTRGRSRAASALLGSTAEGVLHHARRPVLVVAGDR